MTNFDVIIIGGGVTGSSIAYACAREQLRVLLLERRAIGSEASGASAGGIRQQHRHPAELPLAMASVPRWSTFDDELDHPVEFVQQGGMRLATADQAEEAQASVGIQQQAGLEDLVWLDHADCLHHLPGLDERFVGASYCPTDGHVNPVQATRAFAFAATRQATVATVRVGETVAEVLVQRDQVRGVCLTSGESIASPVVINAAGVWGAKLSADLGLPLPVEPRVPQMLGTMKQGRKTVGPVVGARDPVLGPLSLKQLDSGHFLIGGGRPSDISAGVFRPVPDPHSTRAALKLAALAAPAIRTLPLERIWFGVEAQTPDAIPIIDLPPRIRGYGLALGFSGHGLAIAPAVGEAMADLILGRPSRHPVEPFALTRFENTTVAPAFDMNTAG